MENDNLKIIRDSLVVIKNAAGTASGTLAEAKDCLEKFNQSAKKQARITIGLAVISVAAACISAWAAYSMSNLTHAINVPNVGLFYQDSIILENFGNLTATRTRVLWEAVEFAETPTTLVSGRTEVDLLFSKDSVAIPTKNFPISQNSQFLICVWDGGYSGVLSRVFLREGNKWTITVKSLVNPQQWKVIEEKIQAMKSHFQK